MTCIKFVICNYTDIFTKINAETLIFFKILISICSINFDMAFRQNNNDIAYLSSIFIKLNLERNCLIIEKIFYLYFRKIIVLIKMYNYF